MEPTTLLERFQLNGTIGINNRVLMAPMTRCMADANLAPTDDMANYYARRASAGLIITEGTIIRHDGHGYPNTPGIYSDQHISGWANVANKVHDAGGKLFMQIWHTGRMAHSFFIGQTPIAPSALAAAGSVPRMRDLQYETPKAATVDDIAQLITDFAQAAVNAVERAGCDGVEIHGANGYLIDQFLHYDTNHRNDEYGGSPENMARFPLAVIDAIIAKVGTDRTSIRLSPGAYLGINNDPRDKAVFEYLLSEIEKRHIAYVHAGIFDDSMQFEHLGGRVSQFMRQHYSGTLVAAGSYTAETANKAIQEGLFDLVSIGRPYIANPDYIEKLTKGEPLTDYDESMLAELI